MNSVIAQRKAKLAVLHAIADEQLCRKAGAGAGWLDIQGWQKINEA